MCQLMVLAMWRAGVMTRVVEVRSSSLTGSIVLLVALSKCYYAFVIKSLLWLAKNLADNFQYPYLAP